MKLLNIDKDLWKNKIKWFFPEDSISFMVKLVNGTEVRYVNLDNAATTIPFFQVKRVVDRSFDSYGSIHRGAGQKSDISTEKYEKTRDTIRIFVNVSSENYIVFTKNTTEAINHAAALFSYIEGKVLVSDIEHSANLLPWIKHGEIVQYKTNDDGTVDLSEIEKKLDEFKGKIKLVVITGSSNVTGYRPDIHKIAKISHMHGAKVLVDCCQLIQHNKIDMKPDEDIEHLDFIVFSGHKMYAPYGIGVLIGPKYFFDDKFPYQIGGGNLSYITHDLNIVKSKNVRTHEPGTPNFIGAVALEKSVEILQSIGLENVEQYEHFLANSCFQSMKRMNSIKIYVKEKELTNIIPFEIERFDYRLLSKILSAEYGIGVRAGSFCAYELLRKLKKISKEEDKKIASEIESGMTRNLPGLVRASFGLSNNIEDCERFIHAMNEIIKNGINFYLSRYIQDSITGNWSLRSFCNTTNARPEELNYDHYEDNVYDADIEKVIPGYSEFHQLIKSAIKKEFSNQQDPVRILELGIGTGKTARIILDILPDAIYEGIDFSENMLTGSIKKLKSFNYKPICKDYSELSFSKNYDMIVSVLSIHHQTHEGKFKLFEKIHDSLKDNGIFIFGDLVTYSDKKEAALNKVLHYSNLVNNIKDKESLKDWAFHHTFINILTPLEDQLEWLKQIGFKKVNVIYRKYNTVLIIARK